MLYNTVAMFKLYTTFIIMITCIIFLYDQCYIHLLYYTMNYLVI